MIKYRSIIQPIPGRFCYEHVALATIEVERFVEAWACTTST